MSSDYTQDFIDNVKGALSAASDNSGEDIAEFNAHIDNADIHLTAEERTAWNNKAELSAIPSSLPANGGNADTVNGHTVLSDVPENALFIPDFADYELLEPVIFRPGEASLVVGYAHPSGLTVTGSGSWEIKVTDKDNSTLYTALLSETQQTQQTSTVSALAIEWIDDNAPSEISLVSSNAGQVISWGMVLKLYPGVSLVNAVSVSDSITIPVIQFEPYTQTMLAIAKYNVYAKRLS